MPSLGLWKSPPPSTYSPISTLRCQYLSFLTPMGLYLFEKYLYCCLSVCQEKTKPNGAVQIIAFNKTSVLLNHNPAKDTDRLLFKYMFLKILKLLACFTKTHHLYSLFYVMILVLKELYLQLIIDLSKSKSYPNSFVISSVFLLDIQIFIFHVWHISEAKAPVRKPLAWPASARLLGKRIREHRNMDPALQNRFRQTWPRELIFYPCQCPHLRWWVARDQFCPLQTHLYLKIPRGPYLRVIFISFRSQNAEIATSGDGNETLHIFNVFLIVFCVPKDNTVLRTIGSGIRINHSIWTIAPLGME